jgi:oligoribonuclease (3'-5' exoribonuclease)
MVDLETGGLDPSHNPIIQISAVRFDYATSTVGPSFDMCLDVPSMRFWDQDTLRWWQGNGDLLDRIMARAQPAQDVWNQFVEWTIDTTPSLTENRLWAKPVSFEWPYLQSYGRQFDRPIPFHYRNAIDLNSFTRGLAGDPGAQPIKLPFEGEAHDALADTFHQVLMALSARYMINAQ